MSAPEAFVSIFLAKCNGGKTSKAGFVELLPRGLLRVKQEDRPGLIRMRHDARILVAPAAAAEPRRLR